MRIESLRESFLNSHVKNCNHFGKRFTNCLNLFERTPRSNVTRMCEIPEKRGKNEGKTQKIRKHLKKLNTLVLKESFLVFTP